MANEKLPKHPKYDNGCSACNGRGGRSKRISKAGARIFVTCPHCKGIMNKPPYPPDPSR